MARAASAAARPTAVASVAAAAAAAGEHSKQCESWRVLQLHSVCHCTSGCLALLPLPASRTLLLTATALLRVSPCSGRGGYGGGWGGQQGYGQASGSARAGPQLLNGSAGVTWSSA